MIVEATELRYDVDKDVVSAEGNARVYYKDQMLEADRVVCNRKTSRVYAEGHATDRDGTVMHGDRLDFTDVFRDGFIESLRADRPPRKYVSYSPGPLAFKWNLQIRAERRAYWWRHHRL